VNLTNAVGVVAGLALVTVLGVSVLQKPQRALIVMVDQGDASPTTTGPSDSGSSVATIVVSPAVTMPPGGPASEPDPTQGAGTQAANGTPGDTPSESIPPESIPPESIPPESTTPPPATSAAARTTPPVSGGSVSIAVDKTAAKVAIINASGNPTVAASVSNTLKKAGWDPKSESASWPSMAVSVVYYADGKRDVGLAVAASLGLTDSVVLAGQGAAPWDAFASKQFDVLVLASKDLR
jgi:LytR cell envelope-related transcriptional attenuator